MILKAEMIHNQSIKVWVKQHKQICHYVNTLPNKPLYKLWVPAYLLILKTGKDSMLTDQSMSQSQQ